MQGQAYAASTNPGAGEGAGGAEADDAAGGSSSSGSSSGNSGNVTIILPETYFLINHGLATPTKLQSPWGDCWAFAVASALESSILKKQEELVDELVVNGVGEESTAVDEAMNAANGANNTNVNPPTSDADEAIDGGTGTEGADGTDAVIPAAEGADGTSIDAEGANAAGEGAVDGASDVTTPETNTTIATADGTVIQIAPDRIPLFSLASDKIDLSERAIAWFAHELQTEASGGSQAGEGYYMLEPGNPYLQLAEGNFGKVTSLLTSGQLIVAETTIPYRYNAYDGDPAWYKVTTGRSREDARLRDWSVPDQYRFDETIGWTVTGVKNLTCPAITSTDPETGYARYEGYDPEGTRAIKKAIYENGAVAVALSSDTSVPTEVVSGNFVDAAPSEHFTYSTWAQYDASTLMYYNHAVSIVGWDDHFSATNFAGSESGMPSGSGAWLCKNNWGSDNVYATEGSLEDALHWGLLDENGNSSGYFWLSYYDHTIHDPVSFEVAPKDQSCDKVYQYDYLGSAEFTNPATYEGEVWTANIFQSNDIELLKSVSCETFNANDTVQIQIFALPSGIEPLIHIPSSSSSSSADGASGIGAAGAGGGATDAAEEHEMLPVARALTEGATSTTVEEPAPETPVEDPSSASPLDGLTPVRTIEQTYEYAGFHTVELKQPLLFLAGEKFAVAIQVIAAPDAPSTNVDGNAEAAADSSTTYLGLELAYLNPTEGSLQSTMAQVVANPGETFVSLRPGSWEDVIQFNATRPPSANPANARTYGNALTKAYSNYTTMSKLGQVYKIEPLQPILTLEVG